MSDSPNPIQENFSLYFEMMFRGLSIVSRNDGGVALLLVCLILAIALIFLSDRLVKKYSLGFIGGAILTFLVLSLAMGLIGLVMSIPRLDSAIWAFQIVIVGSTLLNIVLSVIASSGSQLKIKYPKAGIVYLCGVGVLFAPVLATTIIVFIFRLYNY